MITKANTKELISKGWEITEHTFPSGQTSLALTHPILTKKERGGYSDVKYALKAQEEYEFKQSGKNYYYVTQCRFGSGYGWNITELKPDGSRSFVMNVATKELANTYTDTMKETGKSGNKFFNNSTEYPYFMILKEKHGNRHFSVPTLETLLKTCKAITDERIEQGYWYSDIEVNDHLTDVPQFSKEEIEKWKNGPLKTTTLEQWKSYEQEAEYRKKNKETAELLDFIKKSDTVKARLAAYRILTERKGYEYENVEFEEFETI